MNTEKKYFESLDETQKIKVLKSLGGCLWEKNDFKRVYFNTELLKDLFEIKVGYYNTGNICSIYVDGEKWSNCQGKLLLVALQSKVYFDVVKNSWHIKPNGRSYINYIEKAVDVLKEQAEIKATEEFEELEKAV